MTEPISLDAKRKEKQGRCAVCGAPSHDYPGQCPRVSAVTEEIDGSITYHLWPLDDPPPDAA
jgi:hypothetical protein